MEKQTAKLIAKIAEPRVNGTWILCKTNEIEGCKYNPDYGKPVYCAMNELVDDKGRVGRTKWGRMDYSQAHQMLTVHFDLTDEAAAEILAR